MGELLALRGIWIRVHAFYNGGFYADYTGAAEKALKDFKVAGMHVVESTAPMEDWDGFPA